MKENGGEWLLTVTLQLMLHVDRQGTPTLKALDPLNRGMAQFGYTSGIVLEMRRELSSVSTMGGGTTDVLPVLTWVSDAEVSVRGVTKTCTQYQGVL